MESRSNGDTKLYLYKQTTLEIGCRFPEGTDGISFARLAFSAIWKHSRGHFTATLWQISNSNRIAEESKKRNQQSPLDGSSPGSPYPPQSCWLDSMSIKVDWISLKSRLKKKKTLSFRKSEIPRMFLELTAMEINTFIITNFHQFLPW